MLLFYCFACKNGAEINEEHFDKTKWAIKEDNKYPYRDKMLKDLIDNYTLHGLTRDSILNLLGEPTRTDSGYLFYTVSQRFVADIPVPLHTKSLVIKFTNEGRVEWRKIHE